ncbi:YezD family protein [Halalkalibacter kiskunsagensis]|uniref:YezD family protein n=1 Tax=Halalkalibacter kiskunsagensis TaxID=1548599 RepID=A0ABV6KJE8_9BACI
MSSEQELQRVSKQLQDLLKDLQYGSVTLIIQDGKIIQLEKNEKVRTK